MGVGRVCGCVVCGGEGVSGLLCIVCVCVCVCEWVALLMQLYGSPPEYWSLCGDPFCFLKYRSHQQLEAIQTHYLDYKNTATEFITKIYFYNNILQKSFCIAKQTNKNYGYTNKNYCSTMVSGHLP